MIGDAARDASRASEEVEAAAAATALGLRVSNEYTEATGRPIGSKAGVAKLKWGELLVEPHRPTTIYAMRGGADAANALDTDEAARWTISVAPATTATDVAADEIATYTGVAHATHVFKRAGPHTVTLSRRSRSKHSRSSSSADSGASDSSADSGADQAQGGVVSGPVGGAGDTAGNDGSAHGSSKAADGASEYGDGVESVTSTVTSKWVRRELRSLTDSDREVRRHRGARGRGCPSGSLRSKLARSPSCSALPYFLIGPVPALRAALPGLASHDVQPRDGGGQEEVWEEVRRH